MNAELSFALLSLTSFFTLINPLGVMPLFMTMTSDMSPELQKVTAKKAVIVAFLTLLVFAVTGNLLFAFFGISVDSLKVVGGVIFFLMGQDMLQARLVKSNVSDREVKKYAHDISITPLAIPMISGPGAITNAIVLMGNAHNLANAAILILSIFIVCFVTYIVIRNSSRIMNLIGETGNNVLMRLMGLIVMVIAVQFFVDGITPIVRHMLKIPG